MTSGYFEFSDIIPTFLFADKLGVPFAERLRQSVTHAKVQAELNRLSGITSVGAATNDQLERRLRHGQAWLARR